MWLLQNEKNPEGHPMPESLLRLLKLGGSCFLRQVADSLDSLHDLGWHVANDGKVGMKISLRLDALFKISSRWDRWESDREKIEVRLAELREVGKEISKRMYYKIVKKLGK